MRFIASLLISCLMATPVLAEPLQKAAKKLSAGAKKLNNRRVAVLPFPYHDGRSSKGSTIISERLTTYLVQQNKFEVIERSLLENVFKELKLQSTGAVDGETAKKIGKLLGVEAIINGTLIDLDQDKTEVNARLILLESGKILVAAGTEVERQWLDVGPSEIKEDFKATPKKVVSKVPSNRKSVQTAAPVRLTNVDQNKISAQSIEQFEGGTEGSGFIHLPEDAFLIESDFTPETVKTQFGVEFIRGMRMIRSGSARAARDHFDVMLERLKGNASRTGVVKLGLSASLYAMGRTAPAIKLAKEISKQNEYPKMKALAHYILGRYYEIGKDKDDARKQYLEVVRTAPFQTGMTRSAGRRLDDLSWNPKKRKKLHRAVRRELHRGHRRRK